MIRQLNIDETRGVLERGRIGRLGCITDEGPYVVPVGYVFENNDIYIHSAPGRKIRALRDDPRSCLQVDEAKSEYEWRSAIAFGQYEEITAVEERERFLLKLLARFPHLTPAASTSRDGMGEAEIILFRIRVNKMTGLSEE